MAKRKNQPRPTQPPSPGPDAAQQTVAQSPNSRDKQTAWATFALLGVAIFVVYSRALTTPFIFDDGSSIKDNPSLIRLWPLYGDDEQRGPLNPPKDLPTAGRPLVNLTFAINYHYGELNPLGYHLANVILHVLSASLLAVIVRRTLQLDYFRGRFDRAAWPLSVIVALVWALHPLQTEAVVYVTQRTELMVGLFYFATLYCSIRYWSTDPDAGRTKWLLLATLSCLGGMASKEIMVTAPVAVLLYERTFLAGSFSEALRRSGRLYAGLALGWLLLLWLNYDMPRSRSTGFDHDMAAHAWWFTQAKVLWMYLKLVVWPWPLLIRYEMPFFDAVRFAWPWLLSTAALAIATLVLLWRNSPVGFLLAWVWLILSPTLVVPILTEVAAERRMYLPLAAIVTLVIVGGYSLLARFNRSAAMVPAAVGAAALVVVLGLLSADRVSAFHDELILWRDAVAHQPDGPVIRNSLAAAFVNRGLPQEALQHAEIAVKLNPKYAEAQNTLGEALFLSGRPQDAVGHFEEAIRLKPSYQEPYNNLGVILLNSEQVQGAIERFKQALKIKPEYYEARNNLANALLSSGEAPQAIEEFEKILRLRPDFPSAHNNLGFALLRSGKTAKAIFHLQQAVRLKPDYFNARDNLGTALLRDRRPQEALVQFQEATRLGAEDVPAWTNLAAAHAQLNQFTEAVAAAEKALSLARAQGDTQRADRLEALLNAYRSGKTKPENDSPANPQPPDAKAAEPSAAEGADK